MDLPKRKNMRLKNYGYSQNGAYFLTVCVQERHELLGKIEARDAAPVGDAVLSVPVIRLSKSGKIVKSYLDNMNEKMDFAILENYVIMPNHVHLLIVVNHRNSVNSGGTLRTASPTTASPTTAFPTTAFPTAVSSKSAAIPRIIHGLKAVTTKQIGHAIWQRSYHDHIIRNESEFQKVWQYIDENPIKWADDIYYCGKNESGL